jgi:FkbM family methyltransferase
VEFGATNGVLLSNTWILEKKYGWSGLLCEPNPSFFAELKQNRSAVMTQDCVGAISGEEVDFVLANAYGGDSRFTSSDMHTEKRRVYQEAGRVIKVKTISLEDLLVKHDAPKLIDYLSIDTEGSEFAILEHFPFDRWDIRLITVEHNYSAQRNSIFKLLSAHGYQRIEQRWDDWYYKN